MFIMHLVEKAFWPNNILLNKQNSFSTYSLTDHINRQILETLWPKVPSSPLRLGACRDIQVTELQSVAQALTKEKS